ncbi:MAG: hypothetical protein PVS2B3_02600 [Steroidobacteraceae bacterium]
MNGHPDTGGSRRTFCRGLGALVLLPLPLLGGEPAATGPRTVEVLVGSDPACETLRQELAAHWQVNGFAEEPEWRPSGVQFPEALADAQAAELDFYNEGRLSHVLLAAWASRYMLGSALLVQRGRPAAKADVATGDPLEDPDAWFIPCQLQGKRVPLKECPPFSQNNDDAGLIVSWAQRTHHVRFQGRYADVVPVRLQGTTYVIVTGSAGESVDYAAVLKPLPVRTFRMTCLLHRR